MADDRSSQAKMSEESFDFICTTCDENFNKTVEAVRYCIECSGYCCQACTDGHKLFPTLRNHNFLDASQGDQAGNQQSRLPEFPTERCSLHKGKIVDMYCKEHDDVFCSTCIATSHKLCPESSFYSIPDMIDAIFKPDDIKRTKSCLKDMMVSMTTISNTKDATLEVLKEAKHKSIEKVEKFEKALMSIIRKAAEDSKSEIVASYQELENELLQDKLTVDTVNDELQQSVGKMKKSAGNRAQHFVCTKQNEKKLEEADRVKVKHNMKIDQDVSLSFTPNHYLMNYIKGMHGVGQVNVNRKKVDMYKIKGYTDIHINLLSDSNTCSSHGCCLTQDNKLLVTDYNNRKLKRINLDTMTVEDYCMLDGKPECVCCISDREAALTYYYPGRIQFVSVIHKMYCTRQIKLSHLCYGITFKDDKLYVTDNSSSLYVYDMACTLLNTITSDNFGSCLFSKSRHITFNKNGDKMIVCDWNKGLVCFDEAGKYLSTSSDSDLKNADGVCVDGYGNVFVVGCTSRNVIQDNEEGKKVGVIVQQQGASHKPRSVCFHQQLNGLFVTMNNSKVVKLYELE
ncbi:hypothetical protein ACF0H5_006878 [Mactra antiquata]